MEGLSAACAILGSIWILLFLPHNCKNSAGSFFYYYNEKNENENTAKMRYEFSGVYNLVIKSFAPLGTLLIVNHNATKNFLLFFCLLPHPIFSLLLFVKSIYPKHFVSFVLFYFFIYQTHLIIPNIYIYLEYFEK